MFSEPAPTVPVPRLTRAPRPPRKARDHSPMETLIPRHLTAGHTRFRNVTITSPRMYPTPPSSRTWRDPAGRRCPRQRAVGGLFMRISEAAREPMSRGLQNPSFAPVGISPARVGSAGSRWWLSAAAAAAFTASGAASTAAQAAPQVIAGAPACGACVIERVRVAAIDDSRTESGAFVIGGSVHVNRDSTFWLLAVSSG